MKRDEFLSNLALAPLFGGWPSRERLPPHSVDEVLNVKTLGAVGNGATDDSQAVQSGINALEEAGGGTLFFPPGTYVVDGLVVRGNKVAWWSPGAGNNGAVVLQNPNTEGTTVTVLGNRFHARGITFAGQSSVAERGEDTRDTAVWFLPPSANIDAVFEGCNFRFLHDCVRMEGRNARFVNCGMSNSKRGVFVPPSAPTDSRNLELYGFRPHSIGKTGATGTAAVLIHPEADFQECVISGFDCDDCTTLFSGFASSMSISGGVINKARGSGIVVNARSHRVAADVRACVLGPLTYRQSNPTEIPGEAVRIESTGVRAQLLGVVSTASGGHGISSVASGTRVRDCLVQNAGQYADNTYDCFRLSGTGSEIAGCTGTQDQTTAPQNKARFAFNLLSPEIVPALLNAHGPFRGGSFGGDGSPPRYEASNVATSRVFDAENATASDLGHVLGTLIADLRALGLIRE